MAESDTEFWIEIYEERSVQDPDTGVFRPEVTPDCREFKWRGEDATSEDAKEAAWAAFESRYGGRLSRPYSVGVYTYDPGRGGLRGIPRRSS